MLLVSFFVYIVSCTVVVGEEEVGVEEEETRDTVRKCFFGDGDGDMSSRTLSC